MLRASKLKKMPLIPLKWGKQVPPKVSKFVQDSRRLFPEDSDFDSLIVLHQNFKEMAYHKKEKENRGNGREKLRCQYYECVHL
jgi:hypothetical protein